MRHSTSYPLAQDWMSPLKRWTIRQTYTKKCGPRGSHVNADGSGASSIPVPVCVSSFATTLGRPKVASFTRLSSPPTLTLSRALTRCAALAILLRRASLASVRVELHATSTFSQALGAPSVTPSSRVVLFSRGSSSFLLGALPNAGILPCQRLVPLCNCSMTLNSLSFVWSSASPPPTPANLRERRVVPRQPLPRGPAVPEMRSRAKLVTWSVLTRSWVLTLS